MSNKYIIKFLKGLRKHNLEFYKLIKNKDDFENNCKKISIKMEQIINELTIFGPILRKYYYPLCQCILYGILNNEILFLSMNSNALVKNKNVLRDKPQYIQIKNINDILREIEKRINIPIKYVSLLPDFLNDFPLERYENLWEQNKNYLETVSQKKAYRLSKLIKKDLLITIDEIKNNINLVKLNKEINYYQNNNFVKLGFSASPDFQKNQILTYTFCGYILEKIFPFAILLDVQKMNFPFEQKFYNYARTNKIPIIYCGQKY